MYETRKVCLGCENLDLIIVCCSFLRCHKTFFFSGEEGVDKAFEKVGRINYSYFDNWKWMEHH